MTEASIRHPSSRDINGIVEIYISCFPHRVSEVFGGGHHRLFIRDYFRFTLALDPGNTWVYARDDIVLGVAIAPCCYSPLRAAFSKGQCFTWLWHLLTGRYGFPLHLIKLFLTSGFAFSSDKAIRELWGKPYFHLLAVLPQYHGQGVGARLMGWTLDQFRKQSVKECWAVVEQENQRVIDFDTSFGFRTYTHLANGDLVMIWSDSHATARHRERR